MWSKKDISDLKKDIFALNVAFGRLEDEILNSSYSEKDLKKISLCQDVVYERIKHLYDNYGF